MTLMNKKATWIADTHRIVFFAHYCNYSSNSLGSERCFLLTLLLPFSFKYVAFYASTSPLIYFALEPTTGFLFLTSPQHCSKEDRLMIQVVRIREWKIKALFIFSLSCTSAIGSLFLVMTPAPSCLFSLILLTLCSVQIWFAIANLPVL